MRSAAGVLVFDMCLFRHYEEKGPGVKAIGLLVTLPLSNALITFSASQNS